MSSNQKTLILITTDLERRFADEDGIRWREGQWLEAEGKAAELSKSLATVALRWSIESSSDLVWIEAFVRGKEVRRLMYTSDSGWSVRGKPLPFERAAKIRKWCKSRVLAVPDGYDILSDFIGADCMELEHLEVEPPEPVKRPKAKKLSAGERHLLAHTLSVAIRHGDMRVARAALQGGADPNWLDDDGNALLHYSLEPKVIALLVQFGADPNGKNRAGETPLVSALRNLHPSSDEHVAALLRHGADVSVRFRRKDVFAIARAFVAAQGDQAKVYRARLRLVEPLLEKALSDEAR